MNNKINHRKKFQDGLITPQEFHQKYAFRPTDKCMVCEAPPLIRIHTYGEYKTMMEKDPALTVLKNENPEKFYDMIMHSKWGPLFRISEAFACKSCAPAAEKAAAKHPDWVYVWIDRGPSPDKLVFGPGT